MTPGRTRVRLWVVAGAALAVLAGASTVALAAGGGAFRHWASPSGQCSAPSLPGTVVDVALTNMGGAMMGGWQGGGMMRVLTERQQVPAGTVSLRVANAGSLVHELIVLPLPPGQGVGQRSVGPDNKVGETGSLGEASSTCGAGAGDGIDPGSVGWVTLHLSPGSYELLCNLPGHYAAGMYTRLTVY
jgi:uncharacterized cupredoxin-like copper-binding protein